MNRAILVAVNDGRHDDFEYLMTEMENLIEACEMEVVASSVQALANPNPGTYVGKGKLSEIQELAQMLEADTCVFADTLSPAQLKNVADALEMVVLDRTGLILEIFAKRAGTREARLQVESANLHYMLPRLIGMRTSLGRQGGASGSMSNKGQGEKQLELDRRHIERRMHELDKELESIEHDRNVQRSQRMKGNTPTVALVGYTNAGKSTLMNRLLLMSGSDEEKKVFEKNMLFATLDTTVRRIEFEDNKDFLLSDTVGFVSNLPHSLIKAFRSTLEEATLADLLLIVLDSSDEHMSDHKRITKETLRELDCQDIPFIYVMNKCDELEVVPKISSRDEDTIYVSAKTGDGFDELIETIKGKLYKGNRTIDVVIPYTDGALVNQLSEHANIISTEYLAEGTRIVADCPEWLAGKICGIVK